MIDLDLDVARRAIAAGARWMPGMRTTGLIVIAAGDHSARVCDADDCVLDIVETAHLLPDVNDPTTLACLESLVRHKHGIDVRVLDCGDFRVRVVKGGLQGQPYVQMVQDTSRAQALITALRKSPEPDTP